MTKKELIRLTAIDLFAAKGFYNISTPMIAEAAQISIGTIYNYFKNKEEILDYIFFVEYERREAILLELEKQDLPVTEKMQLFIDTFFSIMDEAPNCAHVIINNVMEPRNQSLEHVQKFRFILSVLFTGILVKAKNNGEIPDLDPEFIGPAVYLTIRCVANKINTFNYDKEAVIKELKSFICLALQKQ